MNGKLTPQLLTKEEFIEFFTVTDNTPLNKSGELDRNFVFKLQESFKEKLTKSAELITGPDKTRPPLKNAKLNSTQLECLKSATGKIAMGEFKAGFKDLINFIENRKIVTSQNELTPNEILGLNHVCLTFYFKFEDIYEKKRVEGEREELDERD